MGSRYAGVLLPVFSLPGSYGIGTIGQEARGFIDRLEAAGQRIWQILPLCPPGYGASPYSSHSTNAGNPWFIDLNSLVAKNWLAPHEIESLDWGDVPNRVNYAKVEQSSRKVLHLACARAGKWVESPDFVAFHEANPWVTDYALFMALKTHFGGVSWLEWPQEFRNRQPEALERARRELAKEIEFHLFSQWVFESQWEDLHQYASSQGIQILGDIPIYVSLDSVDTWVNPELFQLGADKLPSNVAGVPPDGFSATGQIWGNPLYDWPAHRREDFAWWKERLRVQLRRVDLLRIDHFRGLESYFAVPTGAKTAGAGHWEPGPGLEFFQAMEAELGDLPLVLEDLGYMTEEVRQLREATGKPGIQLIQFAFDSREPANYWPYEMPRNAVVYTGTHDNDTLRGWFDSLSSADQELARVYCAAQDTALADLPRCFLTLAMTSVADTCIIPVADYLGLGSEGRINTPSVANGNWEWKLDETTVGAIPWTFIDQLTRISGRYSE
ncbi:4-alpha-glucanotransferase [Mobiluncus mulieris]|uniref:4-alpha-glucanotransferase n=1 Tax=Mobiluncus mulieris TaxID=2052 RepID=UPI00146FC98D|nr:4-alpha-glucanotransferase [Mobiluncus mulieris]NMX00366.1 4-alpha-glucanotransferase [Mobiluncus mulieris]